MAGADPKATDSKPMTAASAAKRVKRPVTTMVDDGVGSDGKPAKKAVTELVAVKADEVLSFKDLGDRVVVVTVDGQKFSSTDADAAAVA